MVYDHASVDSDQVDEEDTKRQTIDIICRQATETGAGTLETDPTNKDIICRQSTETGAETLETDPTNKDIICRQSTGAGTLETDPTNTDRMCRQATVHCAEACDTGPANKDMFYTESCTDDVGSLESNSDIHDITCDTGASGVVHVTVDTDDTSVKRKCLLVVILTTFTGFMTVVGLFLNLYGFSSSYWRSEQSGGVHFGLWIYCNRTCYSINSYNNWYFGVQACAVMGVSWSIISGILSVHGLVMINKRSYILSLFFYFWACTFVLATTVLFGYKHLEGYALSRSFGFYIAGFILQFTAVIISIVNVGLGTTLRLITCRARGRTKPNRQKQRDEEDRSALLTSE